MPPHEGAPTLSIIIPTKGGGDLPYVLQTISTQELIDGDEVLIIGDGPQREIAEYVNALGKPFRYSHTDPTGDYGHSQINYGMGLCRGEYIMVTDDDDGYLPRAIESVRAALVESPGRPHLFKFWSNDRYLVWSEQRGKKIEETFIGGHNLVLPNVEGKKGSWPSRYRGDFDWVKEVLSYYPEKDWVWRDEILTRQRPNAKLVAWPAWTSRQAWGARINAMREIRNECRMDMTHNQNEISKEEQQTWFESLMPWKDDWAWLYSIKGQDNTEYIGYSLLRRREGIMFPSYGIKHEYRGKGFGKHIVQHAMDAMQGPGEVDIWETNEVSTTLHFSLGWWETKRADGLVYATYHWPR